MANVFFENQFILDTASANLIKATLGASGFNYIPPFLPVKWVRWVGATTAGHACVLQAANGQTYFEALSLGANNDVSEPLFGPWQQDFKLLTLGSGRVYIYF